jgi:hypothetical protein
MLVRYQLAALADTDATPGAHFRVPAEPYAVAVELDDAGRANKFVVSRAVEDYAAFLPRLSIGDDGKPSFSFPPHAFQTELVGVLQYLESLGAFWFGVTRIHWEEAEERWIPETDAEERELNVYAHSSKLNYPPRRALLDPLHMARLLANREAFLEMVVPLSFYREGMNDFRTHRYVNAFINFYFFIEGLFSEGKTKNRQVVEAFLRSDTLKGATGAAIKRMNRPENSAHRVSLDEFLREEGCEDSIEGVLKLLVQVRGNLHHFSVASTKRKGHPLNQADFRSMAYIVLTIATAVGAKLLVNSMSPTAPK